MSVIISRATEEDLFQIYDIERESFENPYPFSLLRAYLYISGNLYLVAKEQDLVLGYIIGVIQFNIRGHIVSIAVRREWRNKGIGSMLVSELERRFKDFNCRYSYLEVAINNTPAINFYRKMGYIIVKF
ncbi:MAG: GNAT family N-acetyltransferase, partial [Sulfolobaceae archaeon]